MARLLALVVALASGATSQAGPVENAIRDGEHARLRRLLADPTRVNARDEQGNTVLHTASFLGHAEAVRLLLEAGADPNVTNHAGVTPLLRAAADPAKVSLLLARGAKPGLASQLGHTPLHLAARSPKATESVRILIEKGADVNARSALGATPLMAAAAASHLEAVQLLVERGAEVNAVPVPQVPHLDPIFGGLRTPLMWAALGGDRRLVEYLLDHGAEVNLVSGFGTALSQTGWRRQVDVARLLLDRGAKVDQAEPFSGFTTLHWAASVENRRADLVELLLQHGANPAAVGGQPVDAFMGVPQTPLSLAWQRGESDITRRLIAAGAGPVPGPAESSVATVALTSNAGSRDLASSWREAMERAVVPLQNSAVDSRRSFLQHSSKQGCVSCHQQFLPMAATGAAGRARVAVNDPQRAEMISTVLAVHRHAEIDWQPLFHPEPTHTYGYALLGLDAVGATVPEVSDLMVHHLSAIQNQDGHWDLNLFRPPMQSSAITATALGVYVLHRHGWPAREKEFSEQVARARAWLQAQTPETHEERAYQLLGLFWSGAPKAALAKSTAMLLATQAYDGGWAQLPGRSSDAYATGLALYALRTAGGVSARHEACQNAGAFLVERQLPDGTWHVRRRAFPFQPTMDSGFPHGRDGWISAAASSWAVMGLGTLTGSEFGLGRAPRPRESRRDQTPPTGMVADAPSSVTTVATVGAGVGARPGHGEESGVGHGPVDFVKDIQPMLERSCVPCHSGERPKGGFRLSTREGLFAGGNLGTPAVLERKASESPLVAMVLGQVTEMEMPPTSKRDRFPALSPGEVDLVRRWIDGGAGWPSGVTLGK
ncbi:MAG: ankyrin repeat domain-containing protein [Verrucomicrobiales bacterium]|nr:ankyrin repeat domain-containing protein [Verrucomicrobiales bacterium]